MGTYKRQFRNDNTQGGQKVDGEICQVVVGVVGAEEEEYNGHTQQELLGRCVLVSVVDLLPHVEVIVGTSIELEWDAPHPMEHKEGAEHITDVGQGPRGLLRDTRDNIVKDLEGGDEDEVDGPGTCSRDNIPVSPALFVASVSPGPDRSGGNWEEPAHISLTLGINPVGIEVGQGSLVTRMFDGFGGFLVDDTAGPPPTALLLGVGG